MYFYTKINNLIINLPYFLYRFKNSSLIAKNLKLRKNRLILKILLELNNIITKLLNFLLILLSKNIYSLENFGNICKVHVKIFYKKQMGNSSFFPDISYHIMVDR
ncbi:hypothetical protein ACJX0J_006872 [Zea mays]